MELRHLRYFAAILDEGSFGAAAARLNLTQPTLSRQIAQLEAELGAALFERDRLGARLTEAGAYFEAGARRALAEAAVLERSTRLAGNPTARPVRLGCVGSLMHGFFPAFAAEFAARRPGLRLELRELSTEEQAAALAGGDLDLGFLRGWAAASGLRFTPLGEESLYVACPPDLAAAVRSGGLQALAAEPFVSGTALGLAERVAEACAAFGFAPRVACECAQFSSILSLVRAGLGWAIVPLGAGAAGALAGLELLPLPSSIPFGAALREGEAPEVVRDALGAAITCAARLRPGR